MVCLQCKILNHSQAAHRKAGRLFCAEGGFGLRGCSFAPAVSPWARIEKREPNAYLTLLYWDTEWYKRSSRTRRQNEAGDTRDYKELTRKMLFDEFDKHFTNPTTRKVADAYKKCYAKVAGIARPRDYKQMHDALVAGDPKLRTLRAVYHNVYEAYAKYAKRFRVEGGEHHA